MTKKITLFIAAFSIFLCSSLYAELITSDRFNYSIDLPEAFVLKDGTDDERLILFSNTLTTTEIILKIEDTKDYTTAGKALENTFSRLNAQSNVSDFTWRNQNCTIGSFTMKNEAHKEAQNGWACSIPLPSEKNYLLCLVYTQQNKSFDTDQLMLSVIDSIMIDRGSFTQPGLITSFAYPSSKKKEIKLNINGNLIKTSIDESDAEASQFVVDREYAVFTIYANTGYWKEAWQRFYRIIAKDSSLRLKKAAFDISSILTDKTQTETAQILLTWLQNKPFEQPAAQNAKKADLTIPVKVIENNGSDCDSRSLTLSILLNHMGIKSVIFVSPEYRHAITGIYLPDAQGQSIKIDNINYLLAETIDKNITIGTIRAGMADKSKWIPVEFY